MDRTQKDAGFMYVLAVDRSQSEATQDGGLSHMVAQIVETLQGLQMGLTSDATKFFMEKDSHRTQHRYLDD